MGTNPAALLLPRVRALEAAPRVYAMQLVAGRRFFFNGFQAVADRPRRRSTGSRPRMTMQWLGWTPIHVQSAATTPSRSWPQAREAGAMGLKLYAQLDSVSVRRLTAAAHRAGMPVWGHAWVQPASVREQTTAGHGRRGPRRRPGG